MESRLATLVLSGGGTKGAFQVGAEQVLREELGFRWERIFGVSAGALNGTLLAQERHDHLFAVWQGIREEDVHRKYGWAAIAWRLAVLKKRGIYDNSRLRETIEKNAAGHPFRIPFFVGRVSLVSGRYELVSYQMPDILDAVWHSATMPVIWEPIGPMAYVDGGLRNVTPLADALGFGPTALVVIVCNPEGIEADRPPRNIVDAAERSLADITIHEIMINDVREFVRINSLVQQAAAAGLELKDEHGRPYRYVPITVIRPAEPLGDTLDFSADVIRARIQAGREAARAAFA